MILKEAASWVAQYSPEKAALWYFDIKVESKAFKTFLSAVQ